MSTFLEISRYDGAPEDDNFLSITRDELASLLATNPRFKLHTEDGETAVRFSCCGATKFAVLDGGSLSYQFSPVDDPDEVMAALKDLSAEIPGSVVEDEEGDFY